MPAARCTFRGYLTNILNLRNDFLNNYTLRIAESSDHTNWVNKKMEKISAESLSLKAKAKSLRIEEKQKASRLHNLILEYWSRIQKETDFPEVSSLKKKMESINSYDLQELIDLQSIVKATAEYLDYYNTIIAIETPRGDGLIHKAIADLITKINEIKKSSISLGGKKYNWMNLFRKCCLKKNLWKTFHLQFQRVQIFP